MEDLTVSLLMVLGCRAIMVWTIFLILSPCLFLFPVLPSPFYFLSYSHTLPPKKTHTHACTKTQSPTHTSLHTRAHTLRVHTPAHTHRDTGSHTPMRAYTGRECAVWIVNVGACVQVWSVDALPVNSCQVKHANYWLSRQTEVPQVLLGLA